MFSCSHKEGPNVLNYLKVAVSCGRYELHGRSSVEKNMVGFVNMYTEQSAVRLKSKVESTCSYCCN